MCTISFDCQFTVIKLQLHPFKIKLIQSFGIKITCFEREQQKITENMNILFCVLVSIPAANIFLLVS